MKLNVELYCNRLEIQRNLSPSEDLLQELYYKQLHTIAFENIDYFLDLPISLELDAIFDKVIVKKRGGGCYELSILMHALLIELGFDAKLYSSMLYKGGNILDVESRHAVILVSLHERRWFLDPGYGEGGSLFPLELCFVQNPTEEYHFTNESKQIVLSQGGKKLLMIDEIPISPSYFIPRHLFHSSNSSSIAKSCVVLSLGRKSLLLVPGRSKMSSDALFATITKEYGINISHEIAEKLHAKLGLS